MSDSALPITPERFAEAVRDLPISTLHLKAAELRNSIAHLDYSNEQLKPYAFPNHNPTPSEHSTNGVTTTEGDPDCVDAIRENEIVIGRMQERISLLKAEVERRGASWTEFLSAEEAEKRSVEADETPALNGTSEAHAVNGGRHEAWTDGTFQIGTIRNGEMIPDGTPTNQVTANGVQTTGATSSRGQGGTRSDEELRRLLEERMSEDNVGDEDEGMHL